MNSSSRPSTNIIVKTERRSGEPVMTQWLGHLLQYPKYREVIIRHLYGPGLQSLQLDELKVEDESGNAEGDGRPDLRVEGNRIYLIIENKFDAGLTKHQPHGYLKDLSRRSQPFKRLIFLVPKWREVEVSNKVCQSRRVVVNTWESLATKLEKVFRKSELVQEFVREIHRRCKIMRPLTNVEMRESINTLGYFLRKQKFLKGLKSALGDTRFFAGKDIKIAIEKHPYFDDEEMWFGVNTSNKADDIAWIGFWNLDPAQTPLLGHVHDTASARKRFPRFWKRMKGFWAKKIIGEKHQSFGWPVPIPAAKLQGNSITEQANSAARYFCEVLEGKA